MPTETEQRVYDLLYRMPQEGLRAARHLFSTELNYQHANVPLSRREWPARVQGLLAGDPTILARQSSPSGAFEVIYSRLAPGQAAHSFPLSLAAERQIINLLLPDHPYSLFLFSDIDARHWHLVNVRYDREAARRRVFRRIAVGPREQLHTAAQRVAMLDLEALEGDLFGVSPLAIQERHDRAFDVEAVTREFFTVYRRLFQEAEQQITGIEGDARRLFTQKLFNRLMFLVFLERKGWLRFGGRPDYLRALWQDHQRERQSEPGASFYRDRLQLLFFAGLNTPHEVNLVGIRRDGILQSRIGDVPYLNGGLFEQDQDDRDPAIAVPDRIIERALDELFYQFNFTVVESTPLDVEVAVDPEMLGRIFEELVTGRHETGSYYTPKPVVAFMGREALKGYLGAACPQERPAALAAFVDDHDPSELRNPETVLEALRAVKACDPACGSGAYLLGLLHELLDLRGCLFATRGLDPLTAYQRKLEIIQHNLYGVDIDPFAVNIARLRLWLSLVVDFEGDDPPPLPNLDFKIETGDSLTAPEPSGGLQPDLFRHRQIEDYFRLKGEYMMAHGTEKLALKAQIDALRAEIAAWLHPGTTAPGFDWAVEFAEVFSPQLAPATMTGRMELTAPPRPGGFDLVLTNPPYVRQELLGREYKEGRLRPVYPEVYAGTADLYVYFFARAHQLLRPGGVGCFISSNKWLRAGYGEKLRRHLLDGQAFRLVVDFGELPIFQAATFPAIFLWQKQPRGDTPTLWAVVKDLQACYDEGLREHVARIAQTVPASQFGKGRPRLAAPTAANRRARMEASGPQLTDYVLGQFYRGIVSGLNEAFVVDGALRARLAREDPKSAELLKPLVVGDDVRRYEMHDRNKFFVYVPWQCPIDDYPAVLRHLSRYRSKLEARPEVQDGRYSWYAMSRYGSDFAHLFEMPKIVYPDIGQETRFVMDLSGYFGTNTTYFIHGQDWFLLGVLNSRTAFEYLKGTCAVLGDEEKKGRLRFFGQYLETLPIPDAAPEEREAVARLAQEAQRLHTGRRQRVERFLRDMGLSPAGSSSRNPLERPWALAQDEFARRVRGAPLRLWADARDETAALTEEIERVEREIDERVAGLYGV